MVGEGEGKRFRTEAVADQLAEGMFIDATWEFLQTLYKSNIWPSGCGTGVFRWI